LIYHGFLPDSSEQYRSIISNNDFIFCPSLEGCQSGIVVDAISCGCIPIVTRNTGFDFSPLGYLEVAINSQFNKDIFQESLNLTDEALERLKVKTFDYYYEQHYFFRDNLQSSIQGCISNELYPKVSVTLSIYNKEKTIMEVINYLDIALKEYGNAELHIIFDGCQDMSEKIVRHFYSHQNHYEVSFEVTDNIFEIKSNNIGLKKSTGKYCVILQDDNYVYDKLFLFEAVSFLERNPKAVILGRLGGTNFYPLGTTGLQGLGEISYTDTEVYWRQDAQADPTLNNRVFQVDTVMRGPLFFRKAFLETYGYLDEAYAPLYNDDMDICFRARHYGFSVYYMPMDVSNQSLTLLNYSSEKWNWFNSIREKNRKLFYSRWQPSQNKDYLWVYRNKIENSSKCLAKQLPLFLTASHFKVSAIVSTYNSAKFIRGCLENLVNQTLYQKGELEIVVIDSASQQKEESIVKEFQAKYPNIIYERISERETLYASWNRAIKMARGTYITNANTDDRLRPDALEIMANYLDNRPEVSLVYPDQLITNTRNDTWEKTKADRRWNWPPFDYSELERRCIIGSQPMWIKSLHEKFG
ncbi:MAG TPA: glycosyltransferase family 2 protein, partial [Bacillales bacterium]|nr:glycosyltransferase family 2 protein [Bacillales bacterium]